ncbi:putative ATP synthase-coupling factor 6 mitochondrial protein [Naja naja]|nr:putative ATP synthase-coupling factor 6 mitochondrial protein [Naja naja]
MILQQLFRFSSIFRSALSAQLNRNIGFSAIAFNKAKELDPVQKLFLDKIREYKTKSQYEVNITADLCHGAFLIYPLLLLGLKRVDICQRVYDVDLQTSTIS